MINGQFFNNDESSTYETPISYPLQGNYDTFQSNLYGNRNIKSLFKKNGSYYLKSSYDSNDLQHTSDYFVGWHVFEKAYFAEQGKIDNFTHLGVIPKNNNCNSESQTCEIKGLIIIITKQDYYFSAPKKLFNNWNIDYGNMMRLDSGGSTQYKTEENKFWELYPNESHKRSLPHMLEVRDKYTCVPGNTNC